jgi:hypothetical protein
MKKILNEHFIEAGITTNDCFLQHLGYNLLGENVKSINALYNF